MLLLSPTILKLQSFLCSFYSIMDRLEAWFRQHAQVTSQKEGRSEEDVLAEMSTPEGMKSFMKMMQLAVGGTQASIKNTQQLAKNWGRLDMYMDFLHRYCHSLFVAEDDEAFAGDPKARIGDVPQVRSTRFAVDLASANALYPSRFASLQGPPPNLTPGGR